MSDAPLKVAIVIHSSVDNRESAMKVYNALEAAREFKESGDYIDVIFDGEGTRTAVIISDPSHPLNGAFKAVEDIITGICRYCIAQHNLEHDARNAGLRMLDDYHNHPSFRNLIKSGYQVINF